MKGSTFNNNSQPSKLELKKVQDNLSNKAHNFLIRPLVRFWQFSWYYGEYITNRGKGMEV